MLLAAQALKRLTDRLAFAIESMGIGSGKFGYPEYVAKQTVEAEKLFQGYAKANPSKEEAYAAALSFLRGHPLDPWQRDMVATVLAIPIREFSGTVVLASPKFPELLASYEDEARRGDLWRLTWHGLLTSYFAFDPAVSEKGQASQGWSELRKFLERTWPLIDRQAGTQYVPDWVDVLRRETGVLSEQPAEKYARAYLEGNTGPADRIAADLGIPPSSWFWHSLVLGAVRRATADNDTEFRRLIPRLIQLIQSKPAFRDEAIEHILVRYYNCKSAPQDEYIRDFVVQPTVWKNPKLRAAGIATSWHRVPEPVWKMVLDWVNERNLKDFFDILAARNQADAGRLAFWSKYLKQISWTRLVFGADTMALKNSNQEVRNLIAREEGAYAQLTANRDVDAFMMRIGNYIVVEFSKKPNAAYVYKAIDLKFNRDQKYFNGGTDDLKYGYYDAQVLGIVHRDGWEARAAAELNRFGIEPDKEGTSRADYMNKYSETASLVEGFRDIATSVYVARTERSAQPRYSGSRPDDRSLGSDMASLRDLVSRYSGASIRDLRASCGGRLWVEDFSQSQLLAAELKVRGFKWANKRLAWYYPES